MGLNKHIIYWKNLVSRINSQKNVLHIFYILHIEPIIITVAIKYLTKVRFNIVIYCISKHSSYLLLKKGRIKKKDKENKNKKKKNRIFEIFHVNLHIYPEATKEQIQILRYFEPLVADLSRR